LVGQAGEVQREGGAVVAGRPTGELRDLVEPVDEGVAVAGRGGKVLALRTVAGVDELETRWAAAKVIFDREGVDIVGMEFNNADPAKAKSIVNGYLKRFGSLDGVWLDAGFVSVAVTEAFKDAGRPVPPLTGDDEQGFRQLWQKDRLTAARHHLGHPERLPHPRYAAAVLLHLRLPEHARLPPNLGREVAAARVRQATASAVGAIMVGCGSPPLPRMPAGVGY
jgi:hypothetical protein